MMTHPVLYEELIAYTAGDLAPSSALFVGEHLAHCPRCAATVRRFQVVRATLIEDALLAPPNVVMARAQRIYSSRAKLRTSGSLKRPVRSPTLDPIPALSALVLVLFLFIAGLEDRAPAIDRILPGDALYPVKTTFEGMQIASMLDEASKVQVELTIANSRVTEIQQLADRHRYSQIPAIAHAYEGAIENATTMLGQVIQRDPASHLTLAQHAASELSQNSSRLAKVQEKAPIEFQPQIARAVDASHQAQASLQKQLDQRGASSLPSIPSLPSMPVFTRPATPGMTPTAPSSTPALVPLESASPSTTATRTSSERSVPMPSATLDSDGKSTLNASAVPSSTTFPVAAPVVPSIAAISIATETLEPAIGLPRSTPPAQTDAASVPPASAITVVPPPTSILPTTAPAAPSTSAQPTVQLEPTSQALIPTKKNH